MSQNGSVNGLSQAMIAQLVVDETPAIVAYVDNEQRYRFANKAYLSWFGREKRDILELSMKDVIGSIYELNLPYIVAALQGSLQVFERKVVIPDGSIRYGLMTYKPNLVDGRVEGFFIHVADVTPLKTIEMELHVERENVKEVIDRELSSLRQTNKVLRHFGVICNEVTAQLSIKEITQSLYNHVRQILDSVGFSVFFLNSKNGLLYPIFDQADGRADALGDSLPYVEDSCLYRCISSRQTIVENTSLSHPSLRIHSPSNARSVMVTPLLNGEEILGVMSIQAEQVDAYGEREKLIFKALATYAANTFVNANAYQQLQDTKNKLVEQEKMAALGSMVSMLAHALNTPIGNSLLASTTVESGTSTLKQLIHSTSLKKSELERTIFNLDQAAELTLSNLRRAAKIIESFKHVAVDQSIEDLRDFSVHGLCVDAVSQIANRLEESAIDVVIDVDSGFSMRSYPHPLALVLISLLENALLHAFPEGQRGQVVITASAPTAGRLQIEVIDNGSGIQDAILKKIFDPFFTTKMASGCCGLGLNISYNLVLFVLEGTIEVDSEFGTGTRFILDLPLSVSNAI